MSKIFQRLLDEKEASLNDEQREFLLMLTHQWIPSRILSKLGFLKKAIQWFPEENELVEMYRNLKTEWEAEEQVIADRHVNLYYKKDVELETFVGYTFCGFGEANDQKWLVCGEEEFVEAYKRVEDEESAKEFQTRFFTQPGSVDQKVVKSLDDRFGNTHKYERVVRMFPGKGIQDSKWKKWEYQ